MRTPPHSGAGAQPNGRRPKERLAPGTLLPDHHVMWQRPRFEPVIVREDVDAILAAFLDIRREVTEIRRAMEEPDGGEEEEPEEA